MLVNGEFAVRDGQPAPARAGAVLTLQALAPAVYFVTV